MPRPLILMSAWQRPTLTGALAPTTIGAGELNFRVRDGNGCDLSAIVTRSGFIPSKLDNGIHEEECGLLLFVLSSSGSQRLMENNLPPSTCKHVSSEEHFPSSAKRSPPLFVLVKSSID